MREGWTQLQSEDIGLGALKETLDAWLARVKSPVLGFIVLAFILVNWKPLWFLVFTDENGYTKIAYFEQHTTPLSLYWLPLIIGLIGAILTPWVDLFGVWIARFPVLIRRKIQGAHETDVLITDMDNTTRLEVAKVESQAKSQAAIENAALAKAERNKKATEIGVDAVAEIEKVRAIAQDELQKVIAELSSIDRILIQQLNIVSPIDEQNFVEQVTVTLLRLEPSRFSSGQRAIIESKASLERLRKRGIVFNQLNQISLSEIGYRVSDILA